MCSVCSTTFDTQNKMDMHFESIHQLKNVERCPRCCKHFRKLKEHLLLCNIELDKRQVLCECGKVLIVSTECPKTYLVTLDVRYWIEIVAGRECGRR